MKPNTSALLDLSTRHLSLSTRWLLEQSETCEELEVTWRPSGYFLSAVPDRYAGKDIPPDLFHCIRYAHANGAAFLLFDQDSAPQAGLPWYEDGNTPDLTGTGIEVTQLIMDGDVTYVNPNHLATDELRVEPTWTVDVGDREIEAVDGALWVGIGPASVRLRYAEGEEGPALKVSVFSRGREMEDSLHEAVLHPDLFDTAPEDGPAL